MIFLLQIIYTALDDSGDEPDHTSTNDDDNSFVFFGLSRILYITGNYGINYFIMYKHSGGKDYIYE